MKKSQLVSIFMTIALVLCMALGPALAACGRVPAGEDGQTQATNTSSASLENEGSDPDDSEGSVILQLDGQNSDQEDNTDSTGSSDDDDEDDQEPEANSTSGNSSENEKTTDSEGQSTGSQTTSGSSSSSKLKVTEDGWYTSKEEVALYIHTYGHLPGNFISKTKARSAGWVAKEGNLDEVCPGMSIGGSVYYNEGWDGEELLPEARGRTWTECDINYHGGYRGAERLVFSNDGLIFYTSDHYKTFEQLY